MISGSQTRLEPHGCCAFTIKILGQSGVRTTTPVSDDASLQRRIFIEETHPKKRNSLKVSTACITRENFSPQREFPHTPRLSSTVASEPSHPKCSSDASQVFHLQPSSELH